VANQNHQADDSTNNDDTTNADDDNGSTDKKVAELTKRQQELKKQIYLTQRKLRNGIYLGQDRYKRNYWILNRCGGVYLESYNSDYSYLNGERVADEVEVKTETEACETSEIPLDLSVKKTMQNNTEHEDDLEEGEIKRKKTANGDLIIVNPNQQPANSFQQPNIQLNLNSKLLKKINFKQMEQVVLSCLQHKKPQQINANEYMSFKWWFIDNKKDLSELDKALAKRGIRERNLARVLCNFRDLLLDDNESIYEKLKDFLAVEADAGANSDQHTNDAKLNKRLKIMNNDDLQYKYEYEILNLIYDLEDRIYNANLQSKADLNDADSTTFNNGDDDEDDDNLKPFELARKRLANLELNIERRYFKKPFFNSRKNNLIVDDLNPSEDTRSVDDKSSDSNGEEHMDNHTGGNDDKSGAYIQYQVM
jgi:hypothetical protein